MHTNKLTATLFYEKRCSFIAGDDYKDLINAVLTLYKQTHQFSLNNLDII